MSFRISAERLARNESGDVTFSKRFEFSLHCHYYGEGEIKKEQLRPVKGGEDDITRFCQQGEGEPFFFLPICRPYGA